MSAYRRAGGKGAGIALLLIVISMLSIVPAMAQSQGGFALSGSFYAQNFELPQGATLQAPDVYIVVFNNSDVDFNVRLTPRVPLGVTLILPTTDFVLKSGEQRKLEVGVDVTPEAAPGEYEIGVTAETYRQDATGIQIMGAAGQTARLSISGQGARITAQIVSPDGSPVPGVVRLFKEVDAKKYDVAYSESGSVEAVVAPGRFSAEAYIAGEKLAAESFQVAAGEEKRVTLTVKTIYFEDFGLVPNFRAGTKDLVFAQLVYTVKNLYKPVKDAEVRLSVTFDGAPLDQISLVTLSPLEMGRVALNYNYIPSAGWQAGEYGFTLDLYLEGKTYAGTQVQTLDVGPASGAAAGDAAGPAGLSLLPGSGALAAAVPLLVIALGFVAMRRRKVVHNGA